MKLTDHVEHIRRLIDTAFRNRLGRMGITAAVMQPIEGIPSEYRTDRKRIETIREVWIAETGTVAEAYEKLVEEFTFTLFNRLAALKVMEAHTLHPEIVTHRSQHGDRSFAHKHWLEQNPDGRSEEMEGLVHFMEDQLAALAADIPLFSPHHPYHLLPTAIELNGIMNAFNQVETDEQVESNIWQSDDVLGWLYESYNNYKKAAHKESGDKTEFNKVSIQSQVYTPRWVVKFLVDNSLGKMYMEMYPDSNIKNLYKIANVPKTRTREPKLLTEIKLIDPATGSGNFLLYGFDLFYDLYTDQIENYGADYDDHKISELIITQNLHGVDLDDRAIQLAQLGLYIKAKRKKRSSKIDHFNIVSSDFYLPNYRQVQHVFESNSKLDKKQKEIINDIWSDLQQAYKFGSLIRLDEKLSIHMHGLTQGGITLFSNEEVVGYEAFRSDFFINLQSAVAQNTAKQGQTFLNTKTQDAITFLQLLTQKYDVAVVNPPYTDSADFGMELKAFIESNYKKPFNFSTNLYVTFVKRGFELLNEDGFYASIQPMTFMYIKSFEEVRKYLLKYSKIECIADLGLGGVFMTNYVVVYAAMSIYRKTSHPNGNSLFLNFQAYHGQLNKQELFTNAFENYLKGIVDKHIYSLPQEKLKIIDGWPFIYWISDGFREKFKEKSLGEINNVATGLMTGDNDRFLRFHWEVDECSLSKFYPKDKKKWVPYQKGGPFCRWYGNSWLTINFLNEGSELATTDNKKYYFSEGVTYSASGSKGASFRYIEAKYAFDKGGACVFNTSNLTSTYYLLAYLNSKVASYIADCLNPTVNVQKGDIERIPFVKPPQLLEDNISTLAAANVTIKKLLNSYRIVETNYHQNPLLAYTDATLKDRLMAYLDFENIQLTQVLLNEAVINELIFKVYELNAEDRQQVEGKMGVSVGQFGVGNAELRMFLKAIANDELGISNGGLQLNPIVLEHVKKLPIIMVSDEQKHQIVSEFPSLYQSNNDLEECCIRHQVNPINIWCWFKEIKMLPQARVTEIALEFLTDAFHNILMADADGIVCLVGLPGEPRLMDRFEQYCFSKGFTSAQIMQLDALVGRPISEYVEHYFSEELGNLLNLFRHLPKTPFIWHLSSGEYQGFEAFIIIYKWNRDSLYKLKSTYLSKRTESLQYRLNQIADSTSGQAQTEKETIRLQLQEIETFANRVDELIAEDYDPKLDDGVGKNIAPLQAKGMLKAEVLKSAGKNSQLHKYLNADW